MKSIQDLKRERRSLKKLLKGPMKGDSNLQRRLERFNLRKKLGATYKKRINKTKYERDFFKKLRGNLKQKKTEPNVLNSLKERKQVLNFKW